MRPGRIARRDKGEAVEDFIRSGVGQKDARQVSSDDQKDQQNHAQRRAEDGLALRSWFPQECHGCFLPALGPPRTLKPVSGERVPPPRAESGRSRNTCRARSRTWWENRSRRAK